MSLVHVLHWGDVPTWCAAVAAVVAARFAGRAFGKQSDQLREQQQFNRDQIKVLELQAEELRAVAAQREREARERRRAQAAQVFMGVDRERATEVSHVGARGETSRIYVEVFVKNSSAQPVYDVRVRWHQGTAAWLERGVDSNYTPHLMPGEKISYTRTRTEGGNLVVIGAVIEFTDAAEIRWRRREGGDLHEL